MAENKTGIHASSQQMSLLSSWIPSIITVVSLIYFLGMRDKSQDIDANTIKAMESKVDTLVESNIIIKRDLDHITSQFKEFKDEVETFGMMKQDVACLKNAFKTGGDPSKC